MRNLNCPRCGKKMEEIKISGRYEKEIFIDRCISGCGIWFDRGEIFKASYNDIEKVDVYDERFTSNDSLEILCPVCNTKMIKYINPVYKIDFKLDFCTKCNGFWFDKGEAIKFKEVWQEKVNKLKKETKITLSPSVKNFEKLAMDEEEADKFLNNFLNILRFFIPFI